MTRRVRGTPRTRGLARAALAVLASVVWGLAPPTAAGEPARGVVFDDRDRNQQRDPGEPGIADVRVSNGRDVVVTDADGSYELDVDAETIVFITKPRDWMTPVDDRMLPRFYYIHQPAGSPAGLRYPGVEPTGALPASIDFPLVPRVEPDRFDAILFADPQPQTEVELDFVRDDVVAGLIGTPALFGMTLGDILYDDLSLFPRYNSVVARIGIPWYNVPGNHELNFEAADDAHSLETFKRHFGPPYYAFEVADAVFVVLDNIRYLGGGQADPGDYRGDGGYEAAFGKAQLAWLERELSHVPKDRLVFVAMHSPLTNDLSDRPTSTTRDRRELFALLAGRPHLYAVAGHTHTTEHHYYDEDDGFPGPGELHHHILTTVSGSWWSGPIDDRGIAVAEQRDGTPNGYHVLSVDGVDLTVRYQAASQPEDYQLRIVFDTAHHHHQPEALRDFRPGELLDGRFSVDAVPAARVAVNLFDGGPRSTVSMSIDGGEPIALQRVRSFDPATKELFDRNPGTAKPWARAEPSSHVWFGDLPDDLGPGTYTLTVRATDEFGRVHHGHRVLEIEGSSATPLESSGYPSR